MAALLLMLLLATPAKVSGSSIKNKKEKVGGGLSGEGEDGQQESEGDKGIRGK